MEILEKRKLLTSILQAGLKVAMHEQKGPANYVKLHPSVNMGSEFELAGMRIERDDTLLGKFVIGRDVDKFEIEQDL
jgi:hypothetical protein